MADTSKLIASQAAQKTGLTGKALLEARNKAAEAESSTSSTAKPKAIAPGSVGAQAGPVSSGSGTQVFQSEAEKRKTATGISSATDVGIMDINKVDSSGALIAGEGIKNATLAQAKQGAKAPDGTYTTPGISVAAAEKAKQAETSTGAPTPSQAVEGETEQQRYERLLADQRALAEYYQSQSQAKGEELATVAGRTEELSGQVADFKLQNQELISNLNGQIASLGDRVASMAGYLQNSGTVVNASDPEIQQKLVDAWNEGGTVDQRNARLKGILENSAKTTSDAPVSEFKTLSTPPVPETTINPQTGAITPVIPTEAQDLASFRSTSPASLSSIIDTLTNMGSSGADFTSADVDLMKLQLTNFGLEETKVKTENRLLERKQQILDQYNVYKDFFEGKRETTTDFLKSQQDKALRRNQLQEERLLAERDDTMDKLSEKTARYESFVKAQMAVAGIPVAGQAGTTMLLNSLANWEDSVQSVKNSYDEKIADLHDQAIDIIDEYTGQILQYNDNIDLQELNQMDKFQESWNQIEDNLLLNETQTQMAQMQALSDFFTVKSEKQAANEAYMREQYEAQQQKLWDLQIEGIKAQGGVPTIGEDGMPTMLYGEDGQPVMNLEASKNNFEQSKYWSSLKELDVKWDDNTGQWIGTNKLGGVVYLGNNAVNVPKNSKYNYNIAENEVSFNVPVGYPPSDRWQCGEFVNDCLFGEAGHFGNDIETDIKNYGNSSIPIPGGAFMERTGGTSGHKGVVEKVNSDGSFVILESNYTKNSEGKGIVERKTIVPGSARYNSIMSGAFYNPNPSGTTESSEVYLNKEQKSNYLTLKNQYRSRPEVSEFKSVQAAYAKVNSVDSTAAGDLSLIFNYMKMLDPGSVVREGEFANAQNAGSVPQRIFAQYNRVLEGTRLTDTQRLDFKKQSENIYNSSKDIFDNVVEEFKQDALIVGLPENIPYTLGLSPVDIQTSIDDYELPPDLGGISNVSIHDNFL